MHRSRRTASPVRVSLTASGGGDIDGAWWPRSDAIARELPELMEALQPALGAIEDIDINWSANSPAPIMSTMAPDVAARFTGTKPHHRLMFVSGQSSVAKFLVIPSMTSSALALMLLRQAGGRHIPESAHGTKEFHAAERVLRTARIESSAWAAASAAQLT